MSRKILLVEDEIIIAMFEAGMLKKYGFHVITVHTGEKAIAAVQTDPDIVLILMDIDLGQGMNGTESAQRILKEKQLPIIFLTSHSEKEMVEKVKGITRYGYVLKNSGEFVLVEAVTMALELFSAKQEVRQHLINTENAYRQLEERDRRLKHTNRVLTSIRKISNLVIAEPEVPVLLKKTCEILTTTNGYTRAWIVLTENGSPVLPFYHSGLNDKAAVFENALQAGTIPVCAGKSVTEKQLIIVKEPTADCPSCPFREEHFAGGKEDGKFQVIMVMPLLAGGKTFGWISVVLPKLYLDDPEEQSHFSEIADDLARAVQHLTSKTSGRQSNLNAQFPYQSEEDYRTLVENSPVGIFKTISTGEVLHINPAMARMVGASDINEALEEFTDLSSQLYVHGGQRETFLQLVKKNGNISNFVIETKTIQGEHRWVSINARVSKTNPDGTFEIDGFAVDVTETRNVKELLLEREKYLSAILHAAADGFLISGTDGDFIEVNDAFCRMSGYTREELLAMNIADIAAAGNIQELRERIHTVMISGGEVFETLLRRKNGKFFDAEMSVSYLDNDVGNFIFFCRDITERKMTEEQIQKFSKRLELTMSAADIAWWELDFQTGSVVYNKQKTDMLGYPRHRFTHYRDFLNIVHPEDYESTVRAMEDHIKGTADRYESRYRIRTSTGEYKWFEDIGSITGREKDGTPKTATGVVIDITDDIRKEQQLQKASEGLQMLLNSIPEDIYIADLTTYRILFMNDQMKKSFPDARVGDICYRVFRGNSEPCSHCTNDQLFDDNGNPKDVIVWEDYNPVNGKWYINYDKAIPWIDSDYVRLQIAADISARKQDEETLRKALEEKNYLMKEINHRVKNNLMIISSLINLKTSLLGDNSILVDLKTQIDAVRIVHEKLHQTDDINHVAVKEYFLELLETIFRTFSRQSIRLEDNIENISVPTKQAVTLGLIINEITTNAVKHGFDEQTEAVFRIEFRKTGDGRRYLLKIVNSGKPFPAEIQLDNPETLGLRLITALTSQLCGELGLKREPQTEISITFPAEDVHKKQ